MMRIGLTIIHILRSFKGYAAYRMPSVIPFKMFDPAAKILRLVGVQNYAGII